MDDSPPLPQSATMCAGRCGKRYLERVVWAEERPYPVYCSEECWLKAKQARPEYGAKGG